MPLARRLVLVLLFAFCAAAPARAGGDPLPFSEVDLWQTDAKGGYYVQTYNLRGKAKADARYATTNLSSVDVANNLKRLASQRSDVFDGITGQPLSEEELARRKKAAVHGVDSYPTAPNPSAQNQMQGLNVEEQIRAIHQKFADRK